MSPALLTVVAFTGTYLAIGWPVHVACDRVVTRRRVGVRARVAVVQHEVNHATIADALQSMASRMRTGVSAAEALDDELGNLNVDRHSLTALAGDDIANARAPVELEQRAAHHQSLHLQEHEVHVHTSHARASARVLTLAPIVFLMLMLLGSASLRSRLVHSPPLVAAVIVGLVVNFVSRRWMTRLIEQATLVDASDKAVTDIHRHLATALSSGHTITDALLTAHELCDADARNLIEASVRHLTSGGTLNDSLSLMSNNPHLRSLARLLADSHTYGTPAAHLAHHLATTAHRIRGNIIDERIRRLPVRLAAPLITGVLPAFILLAVIPLVAASTGSFDVAPRGL